MFKSLIAIAALFGAAVSFAAVDVNKATTAELDGVKGIGPATSKLIVTERKKGAFKDWPDFIARVKGLGDNRAAKLSAEGLTVGGAAYPAAATASAAPAAPAGKAPAASEPVKGTNAAKAETAAPAKPVANGK